MATHRAKPLCGIELNYEVVGGTTAPTSFNKENTIWVDTSKNGKVSTTRIEGGLISPNGLLRSWDTDVVYTDWFPCTIGNSYRFELNDGKYAVIASYETEPTLPLDGTVSNTFSELESIDYTVTATEGMNYLAIHYYDSSIHTAVPTLTVTDLNPDLYEVNEHCFSYENPWVYYEDIDLLDGVSLGDGYIKNDSSNTIVTSVTAANPEKYTIDYIPVSYGTTYTVNYTISGTTNQSMWFAYLEYTGTEGNYAVYGTREEPVNRVSGTTQTFTYTPSASTVTAVRLSWRTFPDTTCTVTVVEPDVEYNTASAGDIWIRTDIDKASVSFNAIKKNELMIYPHRAKQWIGSKWKSVAANMLYKNGDSAEICAAEYELIESSVSQGGTLVELYAIRQGSYTPDVNNNGFVFKSKAGNTGSKTVYIPYDIRDFEKISVKGIHSGNSTIVSRSLVDIFVGTISQITGIDYDSEATKNGALSVYSGSGISGTINVEDIDITGITSVALEPVYIAIRCNSYYESAAEVHLSELTLE